VAYRSGGKPPEVLRTVTYVEKVTVLGPMQ
jgi:hypothetical protein